MDDAETKRQREHRIEERVLVGIFAALLAAVTWVFWAAHKDEPKLRAECEAKGGMLISTRSELYACVGKPQAP